MKMKKYNIKIKGITPVVWNRLKKEIRDLQNTLKKDELEENELKNWMMKAEVNNGNAIIPHSWIIGCLVNAAKETRIIPHFAVSKNQTYTKYISNIRISPGVPIVAGSSKKLERKDEMFGSRGKNKLGGKILRCHPILKEWDAEFLIVDTIGRMHKDELNSLFQWGGLSVGLGDQRYANFGRFEIVEIKEVD